MTDVVHQSPVTADVVKFGDFLELSPDALVIVNHAGIIVFVNQRAEMMFGYARDELLGQPIETLMPTRFRSLHSQHRHGYMAAPRTRPMGAGLELAGQRKDGREFPVEISLSPMHSGDELFVMSAIRDVTERKHMERALRESEERFRLLVDGVKDYAIFMLDQTGRVASWNEGAARIKGYRADEIIGQHFSRFYPPEEIRQGKPDEELKVAAATGRSEDDGWRVRKDGRHFWANVVITALRDERGNLRGFAKVTRDITQQKRAQEQLKQQAEELARSNTDLQQFAYVASHDLQEPLRMVASYTQLLARRYTGKLDANADEFIGFAVDGATRMQQLINDLLAYSRVGTRGKELAPTDSNAVVDQVIRDLRATIAESRAVVTRDDLPTVQADAAQLGQLFQNLIGNALKYRGAEPPQVHVSARLHGVCWRFAVRDNGIGIDPKYFERIFVIFKRLHGKAEYPGTGIGLAICKKIVERHGGQIWVESELGQGATVYFTLPGK